MGDGRRGLVGINIDKEGGQSFGDQSFRIGIQNKFSISKSCFQVHDALTAWDEVGRGSGSRIESRKLPTHFNDFLIPCLRG